MTIEVPHAYSEITITPTLAIEIRQPSDSTLLIFVDTETEEPEHSKVVIDTTDVDLGFYDLYLESFSAFENPDAPILRTDIISIEVTKYVRNQPLVEAVSVLKDDTLALLVPNAYSVIEITPELLVNIR